MQQRRHLRNYSYPQNLVRAWWLCLHSKCLSILCIFIWCNLAVLSGLGDSAIMQDQMHPQCSMTQEGTSLLAFKSSVPLLWLTVLPPTSPSLFRQFNCPLWFSITNPLYIHVGGQHLTTSEWRTLALLQHCEYVNCWRVQCLNQHISKIEFWVFFSYTGCLILQM